MADTARTSAPQPAAGRALRMLAMAATLAGNLVPLYGVLFWRWDTFQLLMLYWTETVIIAFWTIRRLANLPDSELGTITINDEDGPRHGPASPASSRSTPACSSWCTSSSCARCSPATGFGPTG